MDATTGAKLCQPQLVQDLTTSAKLYQPLSVQIQPAVCAAQVPMRTLEPLDEELETVEEPRQPKECAATSEDESDKDSRQEVTVDANRLSDEQIKAITNNLMLEASATVQSAVSTPVEHACS